MKVIVEINQTSCACVSIAGDLRDEKAVLAWLIDDDNRELDDEIESVNLRMLGRLLEESIFMAVFFGEAVSLQYATVRGRLAGRQKRRRENNVLPIETGVRVQTEKD